MMRFKFLIVPLLSSAFLSAMAAGPEPTSIMHKTLVMEMVIPYVVEKIDVPLQTRVPVTFQTPEQAVQAHFSSMWAADWNTFLSTWDAPARDAFAEEVRTKQRDVKAVQDQWRRSLTGAQVRLINKIKFQEFVLIEYELKRSDLATPLLDTVALKKTKDGWKLTQDLAEHPILASWKAPTSRATLSPTFDTMRCFKR